jgi:hypothetical protein
LANAERLSLAADVAIRQSTLRARRRPE